MQRERNIQVIVDAGNNIQTFQYNMTYNQIKAVLLHIQPAYEDFIFFSDNSNEFLYSTNDKVNETEIYGVSLYQARKCRSKVAENEKLMKDFQIAKSQIEQLEILNQNKSEKMKDLEQQLQKLENELISHSNSNQINTSMINTQKIIDLYNQLGDQELKKFQLVMDNNQLEEKYSELKKENSELKQKQTQVECTLQTTLRRLYQQKEQQQEKKQQQIQQIEQQDMDYQNLKIEFDHLNMAYNSLQDRFNCYNQLYEQTVQENQSFRVMLNYQSNQQSEKINQNMELNQKYEECLQKLNQQAVDHMDQIKQKQKKIEKMESEHKIQIQELEKTIINIKNSDNLSKKQIDLYDQQQKTIESLNKQIQQLQTDLRKAEDNYSDLQCDYGKCISSIKLKQDKIKQEEISNLLSELQKAEIEIQSVKAISQSQKQQIETLQNQIYVFKDKIYLGKKNKYPLRATPSQRDRLNFVNLGKNLMKH